MALSHGKVNVGRKVKRNFFPLNHDVNTTADFGFCQPTFCREFYKDTKVSIQSKEFVRLAPLPVPTFGRVEVKTHTAFVPVNEVFPAYDYLQSQKSVQSAFRSYVPERADYVRSIEILRSLAQLSLDWSNYTYSGGLTGGTRINVNRLPFRFSIQCFWSDFCPSNHEAYSQHKEYDMVDIMNDAVILSYDDLYRNSLRFLASVLTQNPALTTVTTGISPLQLALNNQLGGSGQIEFGNVDTLTGQIRESSYMPLAQIFAVHNDKRVERNLGTNPWASSSSDSYGTKLYNSMVNLEMSYTTLNDVNGAVYISDFATRSLPDFTLGLFEVSYTDYWNTSKTGCKVLVGLHCTKFGRRLMKVFTGLRINFGTKNKKVDMMRLLSYYKVWFDKYNPGRNLQWLDTNAYRLIHGYWDFGSCLSNVIFGSGADYARVVSAGVLPRFLSAWYNFLCDLGICCYVLPVDNITCATETPLLEVDSNASSINSVNVPYTLDSNPDTYNAGVDSSNGIYGQIDVPGAGGLGLKLLERVYHLMNKNSVIGAKVDEYLRVHNISRGLPKSNVLGDDSFMCDISDVMATAGTSENYLAEYAGKGIGSNHNPQAKVVAKTLHYECESFGYMIQILCVVPIGGYVQGMRDCPIERYDFYQSEFDSLGMEPMSKSNFLNRRFSISTFANDDSVFGFRPRYFGLKVENNLANGGFALNSQMSSFLAYSLDRIFSTSQPFFNDAEYVPDEELRYIGRYESFGNYDRIFYDTTGDTDNFIIHIIQDVSMRAPMRSISDSYDTFDKDVDDNSIDINKA